MTDTFNTVAHQDIMALGFGLISKKVMIDQEISIEAKAIYAYLASFAGNDQMAFPSKQKILSDLNISEKRYYKHREQLVDAGYLTINTFVDQNSHHKKTIFHLNQTLNFTVSKKDLNQKSQALLDTKNKTKSQTTMQNMYTLNQNSHFDREDNRQNDCHNININTINNTKTTKATIPDSKNAYCQDCTHILDTKTLEVISHYALNQNNQFDLHCAKEIEHVIFSAKRCAEKELLDEKILTEADFNLVGKHTEKYTYKLYFEAIDFHLTLNRILQNIRLDQRYQKKIQSPKGYFFNALKSVFRDEISVSKLNREGAKFTLPPFEF